MYLSSLQVNISRVNRGSQSAISGQCLREGRHVYGGGAEVYLSFFRVCIAEESLGGITRVQLQLKRQHVLPCEYVKPICKMWSPRGKIWSQISSWKLRYKQCRNQLPSPPVAKVVRQCTSMKSINPVTDGLHIILNIDVVERSLWFYLVFVVQCIDAKRNTINL